MNSLQYMECFEGTSFTKESDNMLSISFENISEGDSIFILKAMKTDNAVLTVVNKNGDCSYHLCFNEEKSELSPRVKEILYRVEEKYFNYHFTLIGRDMYNNIADKIDSVLEEVGRVENLVNGKGCALALCRHGFEFVEISL